MTVPLTCCPESIFTLMVSLAAPLPSALPALCSANPSSPAMTVTLCPERMSQARRNGPRRRQIAVGHLHRYLQVTRLAATYHAQTELPITRVREGREKSGSAQVSRRSAGVTTCTRSDSGAGLNWRCINTVSRAVNTSSAAACVAQSNSTPASVRRSTRRRGL